VAKGK